MADEDAGHQVPFLARIPRLLVSVSHYSTPLPLSSPVDSTFPVSSLARSSSMRRTCL
jgi:hypothetical protein